MAAAQTELGRRYLRAVVSLMIRTVAVALLKAIFLDQIPGLRPFRNVLDMVAGVVVLWPFFVAVERVYSQRIVLGRRYLEAKQFESAATILAPVEGWRARFFNRNGEGSYWRAHSLIALNQTPAAERLLNVAVHAGGEWGQKAEATLSDVQRKQVP
jgi:hypothetical protein